MHPTSNSLLLPTMQVTEHNKKKTSTHSQFSQQYDLWVCLDGMKGQAFSKWEAISTLLLQLHATDKTIKLCPWWCQDNTSHPPIDLHH